jgi:hypothetical protein
LAQRIKGTWRAIPLQDADASTTSAPRRPPGA